MSSATRIAVVVPVAEPQPVPGLLAATPPRVDELILVQRAARPLPRSTPGGTAVRQVVERSGGFGAACRAGAAAAAPADVLVFLDERSARCLSQLDGLVGPIVSGEAELVLGVGWADASRGAEGVRVQMALRMLDWAWGRCYSGFSSTFAIERKALERLSTQRRDGAWPMELQIEAARRGLVAREVVLEGARRGLEGRSSFRRPGVPSLAASLSFLSSACGESLMEHRRRRSRTRIVLFTRFPVPGRVKTRLIPVLGEGGAARLQRRSSARIAAILGSLPHHGEIRFTGARADELRAWLGREFTYREQGAGAPWERLSRAFEEAFAQGVERCVAVGSDHPGLDAGRLDEALSLLRDVDLVVGPDRDGGCYLIGLRRAVPGLLEGIDWSAAPALGRLLESARRHALSAALLGELDVVRRPKDLPIWRRLEPSISVIIPTLDDVASLSTSIAAARRASDVEVLVVDGGSRDGTVGCACRAGATVLASSPGTARQLNTGARAARGEVLLFLRPDAHLPADYAERVRDCLGDQTIGAGAFELEIDGPRPALRLVERCVNWRSRALSVASAAQGLFVRRPVFKELGGFDESASRADLDLVRRLRRASRIAIVPQAVRSAGISPGILRGCT